MFIFQVLKAIFQLGLLVFFFVFFGRPSLEKYLEKQVLTVTSKRDSGKVMPPAITIVAFDAENGGWNQQVPKTGYEALLKVCGDREDMEACIKQNSRGLDDTIYVEREFCEDGVALTDRQLWREDFMLPWYGRSYTLVYPEPQEANWKTDDLYLHVKKFDGLKRRIFIHDPNFYIFNLNPWALPVNPQTLEASISGNFCMNQYEADRTKRVQHAK